MVLLSLSLSRDKCGRLGSWGVGHNNCLYWLILGAEKTITVADPPPKPRQPHLTRDENGAPSNHFRLGSNLVSYASGDQTQ